MHIQLTNHRKIHQERTKPMLPRPIKPTLEDIIAICEYIRLFLAQPDTKEDNIIKRRVCNKSTKLKRIKDEGMKKTWMVFFMPSSFMRHF